MKNSIYCKTIVTILITLSILTGCEIENNQKGSGNVTTKRRSVQPFKELDINGIFTVYLSQGTQYKVEVVADENLQQLIKIETLNNVCYIETDSKDDFQATRMDVYITLPSVERIKLEGVNSFYCTDTLVLDKIEIEKVNTGFMRFNTICNYLSINTSDVGDLELNGKALDLEINNIMTGNISAYGFKTNNLTLTHAGTGDVQVFVTNELSADLTGVGDVYCRGFPPNISKTGNGVSRLFMIK
jgi:hypothetical protein